MNEEKEKQETYRELRITFQSEWLERGSTENVSHNEYLVTRGLPAKLRPYSIRRSQIITAGIDEPLPQIAKDYLNYLKEIAIIDDWSEADIVIEEENNL